MLTFDDPERRANLLSQEVLADLAEHLAALERRDDLAGLVIHSGKPGSSIGGANLWEFAAWINADARQIDAICRAGQELFRRLSECPFVTVAAIDGICVGGGAEMASWCDRRIMTTGPNTAIGFPEVKLGLFPGWGGTARAPRIVGLANAIDMVTGGESVDAPTAYRMGLADDLATPDQLEQVAVAMIRSDQQTGQFKEDRKRRSAAIAMDGTERAFLGATVSACIREQTTGHYPAPAAALELMLAAASVDVDRACQMERKALAGLFGSPVNRALLNVFFLRNLNKKDTGVASDDARPRPIRSVGIIGAGIMGQGIAATNIKRNVLVAMTDTSTEALADGLRKVLEEASYNRATKGPDIARAIDLAPLLRGTGADGELAQCDLLLETVVERLGAKKEIFRRLEPKVDDGTVLASNTSTIPITKIAADLAHPERFCGIHFFNPVRKMALVEVIRGAKTSDQTVATAVTYAKSLGKSPIVVGDGPGFLVNRLLLPYLNEALELLMNGASLPALERAATAFGMPVGPITLFDMIGIDTALHAGHVMYEAFPDRVVASELLAVMYKAGRLGQKTGAGFYNYEGQRGPGAPDPETDKILQQRRRNVRQWEQKELTTRMFLPMLVEATRVLEEGLVRNVCDVDLGVILGLGFPAFRGGLLFWGDTLSAAKVVEILKPFAPLGKRYEPTEMLLDMARYGRTFYGGSE